MPLDFSALLIQKENTIPADAHNSDLLFRIYNPAPIKITEHSITDQKHEGVCEQTAELKQEEPETESINSQQLANLGAPVKYQQQEDFEICKAQLIRLLDYIYQLNPRTLSKFASYKDNVDKLISSHSEVNIKCTLLQAKTALEEALPYIEGNYQRLDENALERFEVSKCYSGAALNIAEMLRVFYHSSLMLFILKAKREIILQSAAEYIQKEHLLLTQNGVAVFGNEVHLAYGLFNFVAQEYGLETVDDPFISYKTIDPHEVAFKAYLISKMTLPAIINYITDYCAPLPDDIKIVSLTNFFSSFLTGAENENENENEEKRQFWDALYTMDQRFNITKKENIENLYKCYVVFKLSKFGFLNGYIARAGSKDLIFDGGRIYCIQSPQKIDPPYEDVDVYEYHDYQFYPLTDEDIPFILKNKNTICAQFNDLSAVIHGLSVRAIISSGLIKEENVLRRCVEEKLSPEDENKLADYIYGLQRFELSDDTAREILFAGIRKNRTKLVEAICTKKRQVVKAKDAHGISALHIAAAYGAGACLKALLNFLDLDDINCVDNDNETPLLKAAENGHVEIIGILLRQLKINLNVVNKRTGFSALHKAAMNGHLDVTVMLLQCGDLKTHLCSYIDSTTPLHLAAREGHAGVVAELLAHLSVNEIFQLTNSFYTPLQLAIKNGHQAVVTEYIKLHESNKINLHYSIVGYRTSPEILTDLQVAILNNRKDIVAQLLPVTSSHNVNLLQANNNESVFMTAVRLGRVEIVREFLKYHDKINLNAVSGYGATALQLAAIDGHAEIVRLLLPLLDAAGVNVSRKNSWGIHGNKYSSALECAVRRGHVDVLKVFNEFWSKVDVNASNSFGRTALHTAIYGENNKTAVQCRVAMVEELLRHPNIDINIVNNNEDSEYLFTAFTYAVRVKAYEVIKLLCQHKEPADINEVIIWGRSLLEYAVIQNDIQLIITLLQYSNIKVNLSNKNDKKALEMASSSSPENAEIVKNYILQKHIPQYIKDSEKITTYTNVISFFRAKPSSQEITAVRILHQKGALTNEQVPTKVSDSRFLTILQLTKQDQSNGLAPRGR